MPTIVERSIGAIERRLVLLTPATQAAPAGFGNVIVDAGHHRQLIREVQRLRGSIYLRDGAIQPHELSPAGLHETTEDERSWHLLLRGSDGSVAACSWYIEHQTPLTIQQLRVQTCPLLRQDGLEGRLQRAIDLEMQQARRDRVGYCEVGGWAVAHAGGCSLQGLLLILATFGLSRILGGALGLATATDRHGSASILRRFGFSRIEVDGRPVPAYFDSKYNCDMELLRFDTRRPNRKYEAFIEGLKSRLAGVRVYAPFAPALRALKEREVVAA